MVRDARVQASNVGGAVGRQRRKLVRGIGSALVAATLVLGVGLGGFLTAPSAGAQSEPYSSSTTSSSPSRPPLRISISIRVGISGSRVRVVVCCLPVGTQVTVRFNGVVILILIAQHGVGVGEALAPASHGPLAAVQPDHLAAAVAALLHLGKSTRPQAEPFDSGVDSEFVVPDVAPGVYPVCASAPGAEPGCVDFTVLAKGSVLGTQINRTDGQVSANGSGNGSSSGLSGLARTGIEILLMVIAAVGLLVLGRFLVLASRRSSQHR